MTVAFTFIKLVFTFVYNTIGVIQHITWDLRATVDT